MALQKETISKSLEDFLISLQDQSSITAKDKEKIKKYADGFSDWLIKSIKSATVTVSAGIKTVGTSPSGATSGQTTSTGEGVIS